jgi:hypothetical protein
MQEGRVGMARGWEYAIVTQDGGRDTIGIQYAGPEHVDHHDVPKGALQFALGELGGRDWELVSVTASWRADSHYVTQFYFKRPHEGHRGLKN